MRFATSTEATKDPPLRNSVGLAGTLEFNLAPKSYMRKRELLCGDMMSVGTYVCPACKQFFKTKEELETHAKTAHNL
jgi:hypothetical protein